MEVNESLERLRGIGVKKINEETKISIGVLENILEKRFDKIQKTWIKGFLGIILREYNIDLSGWYAEYEDYLKEHGTTAPISVNISTLSNQTQAASKSIYAKQNKWGEKFLFILIIILLAGAYYIYTIQKASTIEVQEPEIALDGKEILENQTIPKVDTPTQEEVLPDSFEKRKIPAGQMLLIPQRTLWFQVSSGKNYEVKQERLIKEALLLPIPENGSLIVFGNRAFEVEYSDKTDKFNNGRPGYFIVQDNHLKLITKAEYLRLVTPIKKQNPQIDNNTRSEEPTINDANKIDSKNSTEASSQNEN